MKHKYYSTNMKPRQTFYKAHNEKYEKVLHLGGFLAPHPWGNDPTLTMFKGWRELNPPKVYTKSEKKSLKNCGL
jgi:hypothetical protein